jgi:HAD superfamily hydrolase (TIGR01509 family)
VLNDFIEYYASHYADYTRPMEGVADILEKFKAKKMVVLSNKYKEFIDKILKKFEMHKYFPAVYGKESFSESKPHPYPLLYAIKKMEVTTEKTIFVGDSLNDVLISKNANVKCFIIPADVTPIEKIEELKPYKILKNINELVNFVK